MLPTLPLKFATPYGRYAVKFANRPKNLNEWYNEMVERWAVAVDPVMGTLPGKSMLPSKKGYVNVIALE